MSEEFVLLVPLDIGRSYVFHVRPQNRRYFENGELLVAWKYIFENPHHSISSQLKLEWEGSGPPEAFEHPLGFMASAIIPVEERLSKIVEKMDWLNKDSVTARVIVFPLGVGILSIRGKLNGEPRSALEKFWLHRPEIAVLFADVINKIAIEIRAIWAAAAKVWPYLEVTSGDKRTLFELRDLRREKPFNKAGFSLPIIFLSDDSEFKKIHQGAHGYNVDGNTLEIDKKLLLYHNGQASAKVSVGWSESCVSIVHGDVKEDIHTVFAIAMISWFALDVMRKLASSYLLEAFRDMACKETRLQKRKARIMRLTFMDAASASRPIRWATTSQDLSLLEAIHTTWKSDLLFKQVEEQTQMLATHHDQIETEEKDRRGTILGILGVIIASFTFATALEDFSRISGSLSGAKDFIEHHGGVLSIIFTIALILLVGYVHSRKHLRELMDERWPEEDEDLPAFSNHQ